MEKGSPLRHYFNPNRRCAVLPERPTELKIDARWKKNSPRLLAAAAAATTATATATPGRMIYYSKDLIKIRMKYFNQFDSFHV